MKSFELQPTDENILKVFLEDAIGRNQDVLRFVSVLNSIGDGCSIALDGKWGSGKTFFIKQTQMVLEANNESVQPRNLDDKKRIMEYLGKEKISQIDIQSQVCVYYDAWANDNDEDPILSLIYEILQSVTTSFSFKKEQSFLNIAGSIAEFFTGKKVVALLNALKGDDLLSSQKENKNIHDQIDEFFDSLLKKRGNRLVVFIDELDRCKPSYAVQLLERIKHYFMNDRITFVFSVNAEELQHTIKHFYGDEFDACKYLNRFFDLSLSIPSANMSLYYQRLGLSDNYDMYDEVCKSVIEVNHFELREIERFLRIAKIAVRQPKQYTGYGGHGAAEQFCLLCIVPIAVGLKISNQARYTDFINGEDGSPLYEVVKNCTAIHRLCNSLLTQEENDAIKENPDGVMFLLREKLEEAYKALFLNYDKNEAPYKNIGSMYFTGQIRQKLLSAVSLLSDFAGYDDY